MHGCAETLGTILFAVGGLMLIGGFVFGLYSGEFAELYFGKYPLSFTVFVAGIILGAIGGIILLERGQVFAAD